MSVAALTLPDLARMIREAMADDRWANTRLGEHVAAYLDALEYQEASANTLAAYEHVLALFALEHADLTLEALHPPQGAATVRAFLDRHWRDKAPATRRQRLAIVRAWLTWLVGEGLLRANPATNVRGPKERDTDRQAHPPQQVRALIYAQPDLRERVCLMLLGWLGLRKDELRTLQVGHVDLIAGRLTVHGKGRTVNVLPIGYATLHEALYELLAGRDPSEHVLYPRADRGRPMDPASVHRWWCRCLKQAGMGHFPMHELRHSAAQALYDETGDPVLAQMLLRHKDLKTTRGYLHPSLDRLEAAMRELDPN